MEINKDEAVLGPPTNETFDFTGAAGDACAYAARNGGA